MSEQPFLITVPTLTTLEITAKNKEEALAKAKELNYLDPKLIVGTDLYADLLDQNYKNYQTAEDFDLTEESLDIPEDLIFSNEDHNRIVRHLIRNEMPTEYDRDSDRVEYLRRYSGRFMYGSECPAIVTDNIGRTLSKVGKYLGDLSLSIDSLGLQSVIYFR